MAVFWLWGIRNPVVLLAGLVAFGGFQGVADWSITMAVVLALGIIGVVADRFGLRALNKKRRKAEAVSALREAAEARERFRTEQRRAA
ncbi:MAG TPA: hypothetical protein PJ994_08535 [Tepidiformaceae bacterium]|nr:hypothetical protein [Tepidiformaceae bacterium]